MKNLLMFVLSFVLITTSQIAFGNNGDNNDCCGKTELNIEQTDPANDSGLTILAVNNDLVDTSDLTNSRKVEALLPLYDLSLSNFAVEPDLNAKELSRQVAEVLPLYDLSLSNFSVVKNGNEIANSRKVVEVNPVYDLSLSNFKVKQIKTTNIEIIVAN